MAPTIEKDDKFVADMRAGSPFERGQIVVFNGPGGVRISRIAAIPGDRIAMRGGVPILNGKAAMQSAQGRTTFVGHAGSQSAEVFTERFSGERSSHRVLDTGLSEFDDTPEVIVPAGHLFLLCDNRDQAADSRVPTELAGVGMVPFTAIAGKPMYIHWSSNRAKIGARLDR